MLPAKCCLVSCANYHHYNDDDDDDGDDDDGDDDDSDDGNGDLTKRGELILLLSGLGELRISPTRPFSSSSRLFVCFPANKLSFAVVCLLLKKLSLFVSFFCCR